MNAPLPRPPRVRLRKAAEAPRNTETRKAYDEHLRKERSRLARAILLAEYPQLEEPARGMVDRALMLYGTGNSRPLHKVFEERGGRISGGLRRHCRETYTKVMHTAQQRMQ